MSLLSDPLEWSARLVVDSTDAAVRHRLAVSCVGVVLILLTAGGYIAVGALGINPAHSQIAVRVLLRESGGLLPNQDVTLRGTPIGRVKSVLLTDTGVVAVATIDADVRIPRDTPVRVSALSAAGEQYLDFRPQGGRGPFLTDGSTVNERQTTIPVSLPRLLSHGVMAQLDPAKLAAIAREVHIGPQAPDKLAAIIDSGIFLVSTLESVLPQTVSVIRNGRFVLTTLTDVNPGLRRTTANLQDILAGVNAMDGGFRTVLDRGRTTLSETDKLLAANSDTMVQLLGNLTTIAQLSYVRVPALQALFPTTRGSLFEAAATAFHDGGMWALGTPYPSYRCDYNLPRKPAIQPDFHEPYRYTYCPNPDPAVLVRGARNAPRPPDDDTAGPPPGYDRLATTDPTPVDANTIPTPFGGPHLPSPPPP